MKGQQIKIPYYLFKKKTVEELLDEGKSFKEINDYNKEYENLIEKSIEECGFYVIDR